MNHNVQNVKRTKPNLYAFAMDRQYDPRHKWQACILASDLRPATKVVAVALGDFFNEEKGDIAWPSQALLAKLTNMSDRWVRTALADLVAAGFIEESRSGGGLERDSNGFLKGRTTRYHMVNPEELFRVDPEDNDVKPGRSVPTIHLVSNYR